MTKDIRDTCASRAATSAMKMWIALNDVRGRKSERGCERALRMKGSNGKGKSDGDGNDR